MQNERSKIWQMTKIAMQLKSTNSNDSSYKTNSVSTLITSITTNLNNETVHLITDPNYHRWANETWNSTYKGISTSARTEVDSLCLPIFKIGRDLPNLSQLIQLTQIPMNSTGLWLLMTVNDHLWYSNENRSSKDYRAYIDCIEAK